ncbi:helix-turn-helix transcriptional regulator [Dactylosporangium sp. NPDC051541]|uniref:helix-turn-helix transcriptional regulator n=1 Tax=Dactylosporangium sp. NPDC051541 TaxID=3363977 RepID=UPI00379DE03B
MRASRLVSLLLLLQNHGRMSASRLAAELGVTTRTVYRDVDALAAAGVPIYAEQGPAGGYALMDGYRTRLTGLTADEAESLFLTGMRGPAAELGFGAQVAAAELKLMAALPTAYRDASLRIRERFHLDAPGWYSAPDPVPHLLTVAEACWQDRRIEIRYRRWSPAPGEVTRRLSPLGLVLKAGVWYLIATGRGAPHTYRVAAIRTVRTLEATFTRPPGFDLAGHWHTEVDRYERAESAANAVVHLSPAGVAALPAVLGPRATRRAMATITDPGPDGWHTATVPLESIEHATAALLRLGAEVRAVSPPELVTRMSTTTKAMAALYGG